MNTIICMIIDLWDLIRGVKEEHEERKERFGVKRKQQTERIVVEKHPYYTIESVGTDIYLTFEKQKTIKLSKNEIDEYSELGSDYILTNWKIKM